MKVSIVLVTLFSFVMAKDFCYNKRLCDGEVPDNCNAIYGSISHNRNKLSHFVNSQISRSFQYLLMSSYFGTYVKNRPGFEKLYRKMSDEAWEKGIDLIKHITKRGGIVNFSERSESQDDPTTLSNLSELQSLAVALDSQIVLAEEANEIHKEVSRASDKHDAEIASYLENEFVHEYSESIRHLSGYANDLKGLIVKKASATAQPEKDISLPVYIFDEYLQKVV